jgi:hypothetical protein
MGANSAGQINRSNGRITLVLCRRTLALAADVELLELNRLSPIADRIHSSCQNAVKADTTNRGIMLRHNPWSTAREASGAPEP